MIAPARACLLLTATAFAGFAPVTAATAAAPAERSACASAARPSSADAEIGKALDSLLTRYAQYGLSGAFLAARDGRILLNKGYGPAVAEAGVLNGPDTLFDIASLAKTFTAAAILDLEARGKLAVTDPLSKFLPGLAPDQSGITLHHLLTHTSGLPLDAADVGATAADGTPELLAKAGRARLLHSPGSAYHYSNVGYALLGHVVERASGKRWQAYVRQRLIRRAGLRSTYFWDDPLPRGRTLARGYFGPSEEQATLQPLLANDARSPLLWGKYLIGSVGLFSTVRDLQLWWCALNGSKLLPAPQRAKLFAVQAADQGYGWNIARTDGRATRIHRGGLRGSYQSLVAHYPEQRDLIVFALNKNVGSNMWAGLVWSNSERLLRGEAVALPPALRAASNAALARAEGIYRLPTGGRLTFRRTGDVLFFGAEGQDALDPLEFQGRPIPDARQRLHEASLGLARALRAGDRTAVEQAARTSPEKLTELAAQWQDWDRRTGGVREVELLGSTPGAQNYLRAFLRLHGKEGAVVVRLLWDQAKGALLAWGDDLPLPAYTRLWAQGENDFVSHDLASGRTRYFRFREGRVSVSSGDGKPLLDGTRVP